MDTPKIIDVASVNDSDIVKFKISNPFYKGDECNLMEVGYEYPREKLRIIEIVKTAVRLGLSLSFTSRNDQALKWTENYYEEYRS